MAMTFEQWIKEKRWHSVGGIAVRAMLEQAFNAGAESVRAIKRGKMRAYYAELVSRHICVRCKRKHDGKRTQCADCILAIKEAKARR